jgi:hypothetical protein
MSVPGEQVAGGIIDALKGQPLSLALVIMNIGLLLFMYYSSQQAHSERATEMKLLYENRSEVGRLLANCIPRGSENDRQHGNGGNDSVGASSVPAPERDHAGDGGRTEANERDTSNSATIRE